jgi:hypothetical protein
VRFLSVRQGAVMRDDSQPMLGARIPATVGLLRRA